jgi:hypothetical protein
MADEKASYSYSSYIPQGLLNLFTSGKAQTESHPHEAAADEALTQNSEQRKRGWFTRRGTEEDSDTEESNDYEDDGVENYESELDEGNEGLNEAEGGALARDTLEGDCAGSDIAKQQERSINEPPQSEIIEETIQLQYRAFVTEEGESSEQESQTQDISAREEPKARLRRGSRVTRKPLELWQTIPREPNRPLSLSSYARYPVLIIKSAN